MNPRKRLIFLIVFAVPVINLIIFGFIYHLADALPVAGLLALILGIVYIRLLKVRRPTEAPRRRSILIAIRLYLGFALVAGFNIIAEGWQWYDLLYLVFPTVVCAIMFRPNRNSQENQAA